MESRIRMTEWQEIQKRISEGKFPIIIRLFDIQTHVYITQSLYNNYNDASDKDTQIVCIDATSMHVCRLDINEITGIIRVVDNDDDWKLKTYTEYCKLYTHVYDHISIHDYTMTIQEDNDKEYYIPLSEIAEVQNVSIPEIFFSQIESTLGIPIIPEYVTLYGEKEHAELLERSDIISQTYEKWFHPFKEEVTEPVEVYEEKPLHLKYDDGHIVELNNMNRIESYELSDFDKERLSEYKEYMLNETERDM